MIRANRRMFERMNRPHRSLGLAGLLAATLVLGNASVAMGEEMSAAAGSCWIDLDRDGTKDIAVFVPDETGAKLIALLGRAGGYEGKVLMSGAPGMVLSCKNGDFVTETTAIRLEGKKHQTGGTYVTLSQPEGAAYAFFWTGSKFQEVLLAD